MNVVLWVVQVLLALAFVAAGATKLVRSKEQLAADPRMGWTEDFSEPMVKFIGAAEVLGAIGLIVPAAFGVAVVLTPLAATGLALLMIGAVVTHVRRNETAAFPVPLVLALLAAFVAWGRFGPYPF